MKTQLCIVLMGSVLAGMGCATAPRSAEGREVLSAQVRQAIAVMKKKDPGIEKFFEDSYGYAVLPRIGKGAWFWGAAHGKGQVFAEDELVGYCNMSQATLGFPSAGSFSAR